MGLAVPKRSADWLALAAACLFAIHAIDLLVYSDTPLFRLAALGWPTWLLYLLVAAQLAFAFALLSPATRRVGGLGLLVLAAVAFGARFAYREYEALAGAGGQILIIIVVLYTTRRVAGSQG